MKQHYPYLLYIKEILTVFLTLLLLTPTVIAQTPVITDFDNVAYLERAPAILLAPDVIITNGNDFTDSYLEFEIEAATPFETLGITTSETAATEAGEVSIVGTVIYIGTGTHARQIGIIDPIFNGLSGQKLRLNFASSLTNAQFMDGMGSDIPGWTVNNTQVYPSGSAGHEDFFPRTQGNTLIKTGTVSPYTMTRTGHYSYETDVNYIVEAQLAEGQSQRGLLVGNSNGTGVPVFSTLIVEEPDATGGRALRLYSNGWVVTPNPTPSRFASAFGPEVLSAPFDAYAGDELALDWRASGSGDDYEVYGYLLNTVTGERSLLFYSRGGTKSWTTSIGTIPADGNYQFHFINGSFDKTGGYLIGAEFFIDNIRILSGAASTDAIATAVARKVTYENTSCTPPPYRNITLQAVNSINAMGIATNTLQIQLQNCDPTISSIQSVAVCEGDVPSNLPFSVFDAETSIENLLITTTSSNTTLLPVANISIQGSGANKTIICNPVTGEYGSSQVTITITDGDGGTATTTFVYTINNTLVTTSEGITVLTLNGAPAFVDQEIAVFTGLPVTEAEVFIQSGFSPEDILHYDGILPVGVTQNYNPVSGILSFNGTLYHNELQAIFREVTLQTTTTAERILTFTAGNSPCGTITDSKTVITVNSSPPVILGLPETYINCINATEPIPFYVTDAITAPENILLTSSSSNTDVVPNYQIEIGGSGENRTLVVIPSQAGSTLISITAENEQGSTTTVSIFITFEDTTAPWIVCMENQYIDWLTAPSIYTHFGTDWDAVFGDNCAASANYVLSGATYGNGTSLNGVSFAQGTTNVLWTATDSNGNSTICSFDVTIENLLGSEDNEVHLQALSLFPNPATQEVKINNPGALEIDTIQVYDLLGRLVIAKNTSGTTGNPSLDISALASAVYMVLVESDGKTAVLRLVKRGGN